MSLINCPECQKEISDKVKSCPHCGYPFSNDDLEPQKVAVTSVNLRIDKNKKKKVIISLIGIVIISILSFTGYSIYNHQQNLKAEAAYKEALIEYSDNLNLVIADMISSGAIAESIMNLTTSVWYNTIYEKSSNETDKYTKDKWGFHDDFNTSLNNLFSDTSYKTKSNSVTESQLRIEETMKKLQNPPDALKATYDTLIELYSAYQNMTSLAINPTGNLSSYSNGKNEKIEKFLELYKTLQTQIPDLK